MEKPDHGCIGKPDQPAGARYSKRVQQLDHLHLQRTQSAHERDYGDSQRHANPHLRLHRARHDEYHQPGERDRDATYDGAHHVLSKTDAIGQQIQYSYDLYGRRTAEYYYHFVGGSLTLDPNQTVLYYYDSNPFEPTFSTNAQGRLAAVSMNGSWHEEYNYTASGRVQNQRLEIAGYNYDASYAWDHEGRLTTQQWPSNLSPSTGPQYQYRYDNMGRVGSLQASGSPVATASYGVANELLGLTYFE